MAQEDPAYIAARELDATLQKLRNDNTTKDGQIKELKASSGALWAVIIVLLLLVFCLISGSGHRHH